MKFYQTGRSFFRKMVQIRSNFATTCTIKGTRGAKLPIDATFSGSLEKSLDKVVSRGEKNFSVHKKYMNFFQYRKTPLDKPLYKLSAGRSMVEMLGVLAIIGVLSVGAIAGYSKAMFKYKLNKHAESMNTLINNAIQLGPQLNRSFQQQAIGTIIFKQLNLIPEGMHYDEATNRIYDIFNNRISTSYYFEDVFKKVEYNIYISMNRVNNKISPYSAQICRNIVTVAKENAANIDSIQMRQKNEDGFNGTTALYGDSICTNPNNCLRNASLTDIDTLCNSCEAEVICEFYIFLPIK